MEYLYKSNCFYIDMSELEMVELGENTEENLIVEPPPHRSCVRENSMGIAFVVSCIVGFIIVGLGIKGYI